jgi:Spy/CpxP family protein refolding chaperone
MARMLKRTLTLCLILGLTSIALAQPAQQPQPQIAGPGGVLFNPDVKKELKLSDEQLSKLKDGLGKVMTKYKAEFEKFQKAPPSPEQAEKTIKAFHDDSWKAIKGVLEAKQATRFQQILWQLGGINAFQDPDLQKELKLTDEQKKKIEDVFKDSGKKWQELENKRENSPEKYQAIMKDAEGKVNGLLTDEQKKKLKELKGAPFQFSPPPSPQPKKG